jgi:hypothetical protein
MSFQRGPMALRKKAVVTVSTNSQKEGRPPSAKRYPHRGEIGQENRDIPVAPRHPQRMHQQRASR